MAGENAERAGPLRPLSHPILSAFVPKFIVSQKLCQPDWGKTWEIFFASPPRTFQKREHVSGMNSHASPHRGQGRPGRRQRRRPGRLRGPPCPSCASSNPARLSPGGRARLSLWLSRPRGPQCPSCASSSPERLSPPRERPAVPKAPPGEGVPVSFLRPMCHSCASRNPVRLSPPRERPAVPKAPPGEGGHSVIPAQAGTQQVSFLRKQEPRLLWICPLVSFLRKQQSSTPLPTAGKAGLAGGNAEGRAG
jgi:transposase-like protein